jgi:hypothetical protein
MKMRLLLIAVFGAALASTWVAYSRVTQHHRDAVYGAAIAPFQRDLPIGTPRAKVDEYLNFRQIEYHPVRIGGSDRVRYEIKIGEDPSTLVCEWNVYIAIEFSSADAVKDVRIAKVGTCL